MPGDPSKSWTNTYTGIPAYDTAQIAQRAEGTQAYRDAANTPFQQTNPWLQQAGAGAMQGQAALSGDQNAMQMYMNPYQNNVLDQMNSQWGRLSHNVTNSINDQATQAGAFGGSRQGVAEGVGQAQLANDQANQMANLTYGGFQNAQNLAGQQASGLQGLGQYANKMANDATAWKPSMLAAGYAAYPHSTQTLTNGSATPSGANSASKGLGSVMQMLPMLGML